MSPPGLLTSWAAWPLAFQIGLSHLIKYPQCPQSSKRTEAQKGLSDQAPSSGILPRYSGNPITTVSLLVLWIPQAWRMTTRCPPNSTHILLAYTALHVINALWKPLAPTLTCEPSPLPLYTLTSLQ